MVGKAVVSKCVWILLKISGSVQGYHTTQVCNRSESEVDLMELAQNEEKNQVKNHKID